MNIVSMLSIVLILISGCGNKTPEEKKVSSIIDMLEDIPGRVKGVKLLKSADETKSKKLHVFQLEWAEDLMEKRSKYYVAFDLSLYNEGDSWRSYESKMNDSYGRYLSGRTIPGVRLSKISSQQSLNYLLTDIYSKYGVIGGEIEVGDFYFTGNKNIYLLEETSETQKDLEKIGAIKEELEHSILQEALSAEFGLSTERSEKISRVIQTWKKLSRTRTMTKQDADIFSKEITGSKMLSIERAYKKNLEGSSSDYNTIIEKAARHNKTDPEHISILLEEYFIKN